MFLINVIVVTFSLIYICESAYVDSLSKCSIKDSACLKRLYQKMLNDGEKGIPELDLPPLDPMLLKDVSVNILDAVTLTINDGVVKGLSKCVLDKFSIDIEKHKGSAVTICDVITTKANFNVTGESPLIQSVIGANNVNGNGKVKIKLEKIKLNVDYKIYPQKKNDEIYMQILNKDVKYSYDIGNAHFVTEKIIIGNNDISEMVSEYLNANWRQVLKSFGPSFVNKFFEIFMSLIQKVTNGVPANKYISEDLTPYFEN